MLSLSQLMEVFEICPKVVLACAIPKGMMLFLSEVWCMLLFAREPYKYHFTVQYFCST